MGFFRQYGSDSLLETIRNQLGEFGIRVDRFFSEEKELRQAPPDGRSDVVLSMDLLRAARPALYRKTARSGSGRRSLATIKTERW